MLKTPLNLAMLGDPQAAQYCDILRLATTFAPLSDPGCSTGVTPLFHDDLTDLAIDATGTPTRASVAYHQQPDGTWVSIASGAPRFSGARWTGSAWSLLDSIGDPLTGPFGYLMEPMATQKCEYTNDLVTLFATISKVTLASSAEPSQFVGETAFVLTEDNTAGEHYATPSASSRFAGVLTVANCTSIFVKPNGRSICRLYSFGFNNATVFFNTTTGVVTKTSGGTAAFVGGITTEANGWYRVWFSDVPSAVNANITVSLVSTGTTVNYTGDGVSGMFFEAPQIELGTAPTSYIKATGTADVVRAVDGLSYSGISAPNESRIITSAGTIDIDDWDGALPVPTAPVVIYSVAEYTTGERPA